MEDVMRITPLGSGQEVGRSCHLLQFRDITVMLDCGIHPGYDGMNGLPYFDYIDPSAVDVLLITHFHLDHAASLPYFTERTGFKGRIFMTHPTKAVIRLLLGDYLRLLSIRKGAAAVKGDGSGAGSKANNEDVLYTESELQSCVDKVELIDYHQTITACDGKLQFIAYNAGHVLGAAMFWIEIGGRTVLYTGDYSMEDDRHLMAAEIPPHGKPDVLMVEATYGVQVHASRQEREARFTGTVERVVARGGRCLIPVFALGRAQELLLILDEYWQANPQLQSIPIWYASKLASKALRVYQTYANMMNARIRSQMDVSNPFSFKFIRNLKSIDITSLSDGDRGGPAVVFASPGMLQSGVSRQLFDRWCTDTKNGVLIAGYAVENTMAKEIMNQPKEVVNLEGRRQPLNCLVDYVSFSAHVDFMQNRTFITKVDPKHVILVHGQKDEMGRLKSAMMQYYKQLPENKRPTITMPPNQQEVTLKFTRRRSAKVMGSLASGGGGGGSESSTRKPPKSGSTATTIPDDDNDDNDDNDEKKDGKMKPTTSSASAAASSSKLKQPKEGESVCGILVTQNFQSKIVSPQDLSTYTQLRVGSISSTLHVPYAGTVETLRLFLMEMYSDITEIVKEGEGGYDVVSSTGGSGNDDAAGNGDDGRRRRRRCDVVTFGLHDDQVKVTTGKTRGIATVIWDAEPIADLLADSVIALLMHAQSSSASIRLTSKPCSHGSGSSNEKRVEDGDDGEKKKEEDVTMEPPPSKKVRGEQEQEGNDGDGGGDEGDDNTNVSSSSSITPNERRLKLIHDMLLKQFKIVDYTSAPTTEAAASDNNEIDGESCAAPMVVVGESTGGGGSYTIRTDTGLESKSSSAVDAADGLLVCKANVIFPNDNGTNASITVDCHDGKLAENVRACIRGVVSASAPIEL